jgi:hypothetical protein
MRFLAYHDPATTWIQRIAVTGGCLTARVVLGAHHEPLGPVQIRGVAMAGAPPRPAGVIQWGARLAARPDAALTLPLVTRMLLQGLLTASPRVSLQTTLFHQNGG